MTSLLVLHGCSPEMAEAPEPVAAAETTSPAPDAPTFPVDFWTDWRLSSKDGHHIERYRSGTRVRRQWNGALTTVEQAKDVAVSLVGTDRWDVLVGGTTVASVTWQGPAAGLADFHDGMGVMPVELVYLGSSDRTTHDIASRAIPAWSDGVWAVHGDHVRWNGHAIAGLWSIAGTPQDRKAGVLVFEPLVAIASKNSLYATADALGVSTSGGTGAKLGYLAVCDDDLGPAFVCFLTEP